MSSPPSEAVIRFSGVSKSFRDHNAVLQDISFAIARGEIFGIVGPSGAGKSTLIRMINRLERPSQGTVYFEDEDLAGLDSRAMVARRRKIGMIFQQFGLLSSKTARQNVQYALELAGSGTPSSRLARADALLDQVGLSQHADKYPAQLSGGQKQRVGIARALANEPDVLLCDEATSALDPEATSDVLTLLEKLNRDLGLTIVLVTHEMDVVRRICDRVAILSHGRLAEIGPVAELLFSPKSDEAKALCRHLLPHPPEVVPGGQHVRLVYFDDVVRSDFLSAATQGLQVSLAILGGQVAELKAGRFGHLIVALEGADRATALERLSARGIQVQEL
ncbi:MAG: methionine ABC transporter ATP-binding protein [Rhizomicrobium sp.]